MDNFVGQSAIEYLMTYGWMLLVVAVVGGAIFSVTQGQSVETVSGFTGSDIGIDEFGATSTGDMQIEMRNTASDEVKINSVNISDGSGQTSWTGGQSISISETGIITVENVTRSDSGSNTLDVTITYDSGDLKNLEASGTISGAFELSGSSDSPGATGPTAQASANTTTITEGESIAFNGSSSAEGDSQISSYSWSFGTGDSGTGENIDYEFADSGNFTVQLQVEDQGGLTDNDAIDVQVNPYIPSSAVSRWVFEEDQDTSVINDSWGNNPGSNNGGIYSSESIDGDYSLKTGSSDYVDNGNPILGGSTGFTISGWIRTTDNSYKGYFYSEQDSGDYGRNAIGVKNGDAFWATRNDGGGFSNIQNTVVGDGAWHMITGVMDGSTMELYVNSSQVGSTSASRGAVTYSYIGENFNGSVDDVRLYNKPLSSTEVGNLYSNGRIK